MLAVVFLLAACGDDDGAQRDFPDASRTAGVPPPGAGVDEDEAAPIGASIHLDGLTYTPQITRQLNPHIKPDQALVDGRRAGDDRMWLGAFIRVCNEDDRVRVPSRRLALVGAFGQRIAPSELPPTNPFEYDPRRLPTDRCLPEPGSVADRVIDGALVLFNVPVEFFSERPVALEVTSVSGTRKRVIVDL